MFDKQFKKKEQTEQVSLAIAAVAALQHENYQVALELLNKYIKMVEGFARPLTPDDAIYYYNRNIAKTQLNDIDGAIEDLKICVSVYEMHQAYFELFRLIKIKGESNHSLKYLVRAYELGNKEAEQILRQNTNYFNK